MEQMPRKPKTRIVDHTIYGVYVWQLPTGEYFSDGNQNYLSIASVKGDIGKMAKLQRAAASYGKSEGAPVFMAGNRKITESEYAQQWERYLQGDLPDEYDVGAILGDLRQEKEHGRN